MQVGEIVRFRGRRCFLRGIGPMSLPERAAHLEDVATGERFSAPFVELELDAAGVRPSAIRVELLNERSLAATEQDDQSAPTSPGFPLQRVSNLGRLISVDRGEGEPDRFVFTHAGRQVAELHAPRRRARARGRALVGWRLTFPSYPDVVLTAPPGEPPINPALFFVDISLSNDGAAVNTLTAGADDGYA